MWNQLVSEDLVMSKLLSRLAEMAGIPAFSRLAKAGLSRCAADKRSFRILTTEGS